MADLTFQQLARANRQRCENGFRRAVEDWSPTDWATALAAEVGEACNLIQKLRRGEEVDLDAIADELADGGDERGPALPAAGAGPGAAVRRKFKRDSRRVGSDVEL